MHTWAWEQICKPKHEGGLAIIRLRDINIDASMKLVWRYFNNNHSIWNEWVKTNYVGEHNFWEAPAHLLQSGTWKFIAGSRMLAKHHMTRCIGNGEDTSSWYDPWMKEGTLADQLAGTI